MKYLLPIYVKCQYWCCSGTQSRTKSAFNAGRATVLLGWTVSFDEKVPDSRKSSSFLHLLFSISQSFVTIRRSKKQVNTWVLSTHLLTNTRTDNLYIAQLQSRTGQLKSYWPLPPAPRENFKMLPLKTWVASIRACRVFSQRYHSGKRRREAGVLTSL